MRIIGIDPGPQKSALAMLTTDSDAVETLCADNEFIVKRLWNAVRTNSYQEHETHVALEAFRMYGARSEESMMTILWTGRFIERIASVAHAWELLYRDEVKAALCPGCKHPKDPDVRAAIIDRYGGKEKAIGNKANPGPLHQVRSHCWAALAVALVARERLCVST